MNQPPCHELGRIEKKRVQPRWRGK